MEKRVSGSEIGRKKKEEASGGVEPPHRGFAIHCLSHLATTPFVLLVLMPSHPTVKAEITACIECVKYDA